MGKYALVYGLIGGAIVSTSFLVGYFTGMEHGDHSLITGYLIMIVALSMIFIGIKRYRDQICGGVIKFAPAFLLGMMISIVAGLCYVAGWEWYMAATDYSFMSSYVDQMIEAKRAAGLAGEALETEIAKLRKLEVDYANPAFRLPMTFLEIFPVGLLITLLSAAILRNPKVLPARAVR